jgi:small-conductance mechanosensitive channel
MLIYLSNAPLAALAVTEEERQYAQQAERLADHEVDQAFAGALRQARMEEPHALTGEALALSQKLKQRQQIIREDQARLDALTQATAASSPRNHPATPVTATTDLDVAKAQLALDSDIMADAQQDLARLVGDQKIRIQQELAAHEAAMRSYDAQSHNEGAVATVSDQRHGTLAGRIGAWFAQSKRHRLLQQARQQALAAAAVLTTEHNTLQSESDRTLSRNVSMVGSNSVPNRSDQLTALQNRSLQRQLLTIYDDRIQTERQLADVYRRWADQVLLQHRIVLHLILQSLTVLAFLVLGVLVFDRLIRRLVERPGLDRRRRQTLRLLLQFGVQCTGVLLGLFVIFGAPSQMPTILGLTTAGLTVVLQDFIIAFFGWFILMGKNGIRVGDWVEINGVGGEVAEVGLFRTALLETGNWTEKGHPTGRRVTFINNFAIKGQFFNFSTIGQWMWDEITVSLPAGSQSNATIDRIREAVLQETAVDARLAEQEWCRVPRQSSVGLSRFTADLAVDMRPGGSGIDVIVRYVTRASSRFERKNRLYQCVLPLLHRPAAGEQVSRGPQAIREESLCDEPCAGPHG